MTTKPQRIVVLGGGPGAERDVSLASAEAVATALRRQHTVELVCLEKALLPGGLDPSADIVFPVIHGTYGEDGVLQAELEAAGFAYAGCDAACSRLCIDKRAAKEVARRVDLPVAPEAVVTAGDAADTSALVEQLGGELVVKPVAEGSSVGLHVVSGSGELGAVLRELGAGDWMVEARVRGHDVTVGVLDGEALGVVEILPSGGVYDYTRKYTPGSTTYRYPAEIPASVAEAVRADAVKLFTACGCRDFARIDFILRPDGAHVFLEINTIPGMTATSLLPKSASCLGFAFEELVERMCTGAFARFSSSKSLHSVQP
ncbi:MAG: D-alanine--D-alanine ligase [Opitutales bacterium]|nr:D-alanine--D-alanine ligase [Opitutales bacterium]